MRDGKIQEIAQLPTHMTKVFGIPEVRSKYTCRRIRQIHIVPVLKIKPWDFKNKFNEGWGGWRVVGLALTRGAHRPRAKARRSCHLSASGRCTVRPPSSPRNTVRVAPRMLYI